MEGGKENVITKYILQVHADIKYVWFWKSLFVVKASKFNLDVIIKSIQTLGLDLCAHIMVPNKKISAILGGQRKHVTIGKTDKNG